MKHRSFPRLRRRACSPLLPATAALTLALTLPLGFLAGCGGGGGSGSPTGVGTPGAAETRRVAVEVSWPERGRAAEAVSAPDSALSLRVVLKGAMPDGTDLAFTVNRGDNPAAFRQSYVSPAAARVGEWNLEVHCHAAPDGGGEEVGLANALARVEARAGDNGVSSAVLARLEMRARIVRVVVQPGQSVTAGGPRAELRFTCYDAEGRIVPVSHGSALFEVVEGADFLRVVERHLVEGVAPGTARVRVRVGDAVSEPEAVRVLAPASDVRVTIRPERLELFTGQSETFAATVTGTDNQAVTWSVREGSPAGGTITDGGRYTAPETPGEYHVVATSVADPTKSATAVVIVKRRETTGEGRVRKVTLATNDLVWDPITRRIWASVPDRAGEARGGSVTAIDPETGAIGDSFRVGSNPNKLARARGGGDSRALWVGVDGERALRRFDLGSRTSGPLYSLGREEGRGSFVAEDIEVMPGSPESVAVARRNLERSPRHEGVAIYDNGAPRSLKTPGFVPGSNALAFGAAAGKLYGIDNETPEFGYRRMEVGAQGVQIVSTHGDVFAGLGADIAFDDGRLYHTSGRVISPDTRAVLGTFPEIGEGALVLPDSARGYVYFLTGAGQTKRLRIFDRNTYQQVGSIEVAGVLGRPTSLIRWGDAGVAFRTNEDQVFLIRPVTP
ncbi:MAG TPA: hypothetical protein VM490_15970 [Armatimonadaceae bacterium]|nr:hypothetical protein [Armatimonadaceae bacterium]